jgi:hypothetical protein
MRPFRQVRINKRRPSHVGEAALLPERTTGSTTHASLLLLTAATWIHRTRLRELGVIHAASLYNSF